MDFFAKKAYEKLEVPKVNLTPQKVKKSYLKAEKTKNIEIVLKKTRIALEAIPQAFD